VKRTRGASCLLLLALICLLAVPAAASAQLELQPGDIELELLNSAGQPEVRAGAHPDRLVMGVRFTDTGGQMEHAKDIVFSLPEGLAGNLSAAPACPRDVFAELPYGSGEVFCDRATTRVGQLLESTVPAIFNVEPAPNEVGAFGQGIDFPLKFSVAPKVDGTLEMQLKNLAEPTEAEDPPDVLKFELWGVPSDHLEGAIPRRPMLSNPTRCGAAPVISVSAHTWQRPERWFSGTGVFAHPLTGCEALGFQPTTELSLGDLRADAPTGTDVAIAIPANEDPDGQSSSQVKAVQVVLPDGMTVSPGGASGLATCSDAQLAVKSAADAECPGTSRVGSVRIDASSLGSDPLQGKVYLGQELPGARFRLFVVVQGRGFQMKFIGAMETDSRTGRLTANLSDLPQLPFDAMTLHFDGGPNALLATPLTCGPAKAQATFTPYSGTAPVQSSATVSIAGPGGGGCSGQPPFSPSFSGGSTSAAAGKSTSFRATLIRKDGEQLPARMEIAFPPGMSATLGTVKSCAEADAARGTCPASSQIGSALAELGPGPDPAQVKGQMFLTGPYKGQPHGMAMAFSGKVGPLDLGTLVVRGSMRVAPENGQLSAVIDSLPRFFEGISVRFQAIGMRIDRPGFLSNPTSCAPSSLVATSGSVTGQTSRAEVPFKVNGCVNLPFKPRFALALRGRSQLKKGGRPGLGVEVGMAKGANLRQADISLPGPLRLDAGGVREICARRKATEGKCSRRAQVGTATASTPLLNEPLKGGVYIAQPKGGGPPDLWTHLEGEGLTLDMQSNAVSEDGKLHTKFTDLPDLPVTKLAIDFVGGKHGLFELKSGLCRQGKAKRLRGKALSVGQNGAQVRASVPVAARPSC
jgi:hypothetical protein